MKKDALSDNGKKEKKKDADELKAKKDHVDDEKKNHEKDKKIAEKAKEADEKAGGPKPRPKKEKEETKEPEKRKEYKKDDMYPKHKEFVPAGGKKDDKAKDDDSYFNNLYKSDYKHPKDGH